MFLVFMHAFVLFLYWPPSVNSWRHSDTEV